MNNELAMTLKGIFGEKYIIPLYQRNFAWRTDEIQQLLQDVYEAYKKSPEGNYYIGSLVVLKRHNGDYEVIDGQQRLTVISMIAILLNRLPRPILSYDSRPEVQEFFELLCGKPEEAMKLNKPSLFYLKEAYDYISGAQVGDENEKVKFLEVDGVAGYFMENVILVRNEIPEDTDVAAYFEIMNNRGEQLQKHEIVKSQMMEKIQRDDGLYDLERQRQFAKLWDACAQMDVPVQRLFTAPERREYFGEQYEGFRFDLHAQGEGRARQEGSSIVEILARKTDGETEDRNTQSEDDLPETDANAYNSIIDFPNFLMHVLRLYLLEVKKFDVEVPLNEKELLSVYSDNEARIDSMEFIKLLLFCRTVFDRFIVKSGKDDSDQEDGRRWILVKPSKYDKNWQLTNSFEEEQNRRLIKALSMLQVTFRTRIYKNWLYDALKWLHRECFESGNLSSVSGGRYLAFLHDWMLNYYDKQNLVIQRVPEDVVPTPENSYSQGTATPHFLLNFIDYLYCCEDPIKYLNTFDFKYLNSVEHHFAQNKAGENCTYIDNLGNLCLVSRGTNSRLSDRDAREKAEAYGKGRIGPNRSVIYAKTNEKAHEGQTWDMEQIRQHYNDLVGLLARRRELLGE